MFSKKDIDTFNDNINDIKEKLLDKENVLFFPTFKDRKAMEALVFEFLKDSKRKIYGGYAINKHIIQKNVNEGFYELDKEVADIDFYSPDPINDSIKIAHMFLEKGYKNIKASEAQHKETYTVFVEYIKVCDISYVPKNIYNRIPYTEIQNIYYTGPHFIMIDMLRILTDFSSGLFRWEKTFPRICLLQKYYPFTESKQIILSMNKIAQYSFLRDNAGSQDDEKKEFKYNLVPEDEILIKKMLEYIQTLFIDNNSVLLYGDYAYNCFIKESKNQQIKPVNIYQYDIVSFDYINDSKKIYEAIKNKFSKDGLLDLSIVEYYPFWMLTGYSCSICYKQYPLINITHYNNRCVPTKTINNIKIASFDYNLLLTLIDSIKARVIKSNDMMNYKNNQVYNLIKCKNIYFKENQKRTFLDNTLFQEFIIDCQGDIIDPKRELQLIRKEKALKKKLIIWRYDPEDAKDVKEKDNITFKFLNSSGNLIRSVKNLKVNKIEESI